MTDDTTLSRRDFLKMAAATGLGASLAKTGAASAQGNAVGGKNEMAEPGHLGEPYDLAGKRLVFTNWHYVRPGNFAWSDEKGGRMSLRASVGPWDAHFRRFDYPYGIKLAVQPAQRAIRKGPGFNTIIQEGKLYRGWSGSYMESKDGWDWRQVADFSYVKQEGEASYGPSAVFIDPSAPPEERYKSIWNQDATPEQFEAYRKRRPNDIQSLALDADPGRVHAVFGAVSPDGIRWTRLPEPIVIEHSDTHIVAYYDERLRKCVMYTRNYPVAPRSQSVPYDGFKDIWESCRRSIGRSETEDFRNFPVSEVILEPPLDLYPSDMLYTNGRTTIPGAPDHHLLFPTVWHTSVDNTSVIVYSSFNGKLWDRLPGGPVIGTASFGEPDGGCIFAHPNLIELPNGDFALGYTGCTFPHKYPRGQVQCEPGYAIWPKGRLIALEAAELGYFATVKLVPPGRRLKINAVTDRAGSILVEVFDLNRQPIKGRTFEDATPIIGDQHWTPVTWKDQDDLGFKEGVQIGLRFRLDHAKIFGLEFE